ncbi:MAG: LD-carboxypeptidase [Patescibacteria group bacterium]
MAQIIKPQALKPGDTIGLITPSEPVTQVCLEKIIRFLEKNGYKVKTGAHVQKAIGDYVAGTPAERANDLNWAFSDPEIQAVFAVVGGMGASQILDQVIFDVIVQNPKIFVGYSDTTTLQMAILARTGMVTFHGPNALSLPDLRSTGYTMTNFWRMLTTRDEKILIKPQSVWQEVREGSCEGVTFGGNLSCICKLLGTKWDPLVALPKLFGEETKYLFFWEEDYEQFSEIARNLWQLRNSGFFEKVSGMMIGKLTAVAEKDYQNFPQKKDLIKQVTEPYNFPVLYGVDFGHEVPKATIPIGVRALMDTKEKRLELLEPGVV